MTDKTTDKKTDKTEAKTDALIVSLSSVKIDKNFAKLETEIRQANKSFLIIGSNLTVINEGKLYKQRNFPTFELYVSVIFDFTRDYAYKIMNATRIYRILEKNCKPSELPRTESQCRPLTKLEKDADILKVWENVKASGKITAKIVTDFVNQSIGKGGAVQEGTPADTAEGEGGSVEAETEAGDVNYQTKCKLLEAEIVRLENELEKARSAKGGIAGTKMARKMIQAGFAALVNTATDSQQAELIATKKALLG